MRRFDLDFELFSVDFSHTLDFSETDGVTVVEAVLLFLVETDETPFLLSDASDVYDFAFLSSGIKDAVLVSKIYESEAVESEVASIDESSVLLVHSLVEFNEIVPIVAIKYDSTIVVGGSA